jgi:hypothetical protein
MRVVLFAVVLLASQVVSFNVVGYLPEYRVGGISDWGAVLHHVTHLVLFSVEIAMDGSVAELSRLPAPDVFANILQSAAVCCS